MSTRLYIDPTTIPYTPSTIRGAWDATGSPSTGKLNPFPTGSNTAITKTETSSTNNYDILFGRWVSDGLLAAHNFGGTLSMAIRAQEANADANAHLHIHVYVTQGDSDTPRGTLITDYVHSTELSTTNGGYSFSGVSVSSVNAQVGDRIVIEIGVQMQNTHTTSRNIVLSYGGTATTDLAGTNTTAGRPKWIEFSDDFQVLPLVETLTDNFDDNSIDTGKWSDWSGGQMTETGGQIQNQGSTTSDDYGGMDSVGVYDVIGSRAFVKVVDPGHSDPNRTTQPIAYVKNSDNTVYFEIIDGQISCWTNIAGSYTQRGSDVTYNPAVHVYIGMRETGGTFYWEYSTDGDTWTTITSMSTSSLFPLHSVSLTVFMLGNYAALGSAGLPAIFDDFNIAGTPPPDTDLMETLTDNFNDNSVDSGKWTQTVNGGAALTETNNQLETDLPSSADSGDYAELGSLDEYNLEDSYMHIMTVETPNPATAANAYMFAYQDTDNWVRFVLEAGTLYFQRRDGASQATVDTVTFNATTHKWWRIREASGTIYFETSPDNDTWTQRASYAYSTIDFTSVRALIGSNCYQSETNPGSFIFDNFNTDEDEPPAGPTVAQLSGAFMAHMM